MFEIVSLLVFCTFCRVFSNFAFITDFAICKVILSMVVVPTLSIVATAVLYWCWLAVFAIVLLSLLLELGVAITILLVFDYLYQLIFVIV